jgi:hypothetical protein
MVYGAAPPNRTICFAVENLQFLPQYLSIDKFRDDYQYFVNLRVLFEASSQLYGG